MQSKVMDYMRALLYKVIWLQVLVLMAAGIGGCIKREDQMLAYMEKKYKEPFTMVGSYGGQIGKDYVMIRVKSSSRPTDQALVRVIYDEKGNVYQDNYLGFLLKDEIEAVIQREAEMVYGECKVFYKVPHLVFPASFKMDMDVEEFLKHPESMVQVFIYVKEGIETSRMHLEKFRTQLYGKGYRIKGVVSYPSGRELYERMSSGQISRDGFAGYTAAEEAVFAMDENGKFRYVKWKGDD